METKWSNAFALKVSFLTARHIRTANPDDGEFKALVESAGLTGVTFKKVWSGGR
jgi:hypothetical protein